MERVDLRKERRHRSAVLLICEMLGITNSILNTYIKTGKLPVKKAESKPVKKAEK
jgi:predicted site-specific integrase-resolvase